MYVHLKQSGELLASQGEAGELWTTNGIVASVEKIQSAFEDRERLNIEGLALVSGAGNIIRGNTLKHEGIAGKLADFLGRLSTIKNTVVLAEALSERGIPNQVFLAETMRIEDASLETGYIDTYSAEAVAEAYDRERVVLIAGGTGEDDKTTDNAVLEYARKFREHRSDAEVLVLKGTKHDGVYDKDPAKAKSTNVRRFTTISAGFMLRNYEQFPVVDEACLRTIQETGIALRVYRDNAHDLQSVVSGARVGTLITQGSDAPVFAGFDANLVVTSPETMHQ